MLRNARAISTDQVYVISSVSRKITELALRDYIKAHGGIKQKLAQEALDGLRRTA